MEIALGWDKPLALRKDRVTGAYNVDLEKIPEGKPGIYLFFRSWGTSHQTLYVGRAINLRKRIDQQMNNFRLMNGIERSGSGSKKLVFGQYLPNKGAKINTMLPIIEQEFIRHFLEIGHPLLNISGTNIILHSINSERLTLKSLIPKVIHFERKKTK